VARKKNGLSHEVPFGWAGPSKYPSHSGPFAPSHPLKKRLQPEPQEKKQLMVKSRGESWRWRRRRRLRESAAASAAGVGGCVGVNRPGQRCCAAWLVLDGDAGRVVLDGDAGRVVLDGGEGIASISTSRAILSGNATSSFLSSPLRLGFLCMSWLRSWFLFECSIWLGGASFLDLGVVGA
jgi:hypothetical protein